MSQMLRFQHFTPYNDIAFDAFIEYLPISQIRFWTTYAKALGVSRQTIYRWRQHPRFRNALILAVSTALKEMQEAGKNDWRMWKEMLVLYGVTSAKKTKSINSNTIIALLDKIDKDVSKKTRIQLSH